MSAFTVHRVDMANKIMHITGDKHACAAAFPRAPDAIPFKIAAKLTAGAFDPNDSAIRDYVERNLGHDSLAVTYAWVKPDSMIEVTVGGLA